MENMNSDWTILFVDDDEDDYILTHSLLSEIKNQNIHLEWAPEYQDALQKLSSSDWDAILVDYDLGLENGIQLIRAAISNGVTSPLIMVTGRGRYEVDVEAMQAGAFDYVTKDELSSSLLERVIRYAKERQRNERLLEQRVQERTEELQAALEELQVMEEELRTQLEGTLQSQADREASTKRYLDLFELAPSAYLVTDPYGVILDANLAATKLFNLNKVHLIGKVLAVFVPLEDRPDFRSRVNKLSRTKDIQEWDLCLQPSTFDTEKFHAVVSPVRGLKGEIITIRWLLYRNKAAENE